MNNDYPKIYLYRRLVQAKLFIDENYSGKINLDNIAGEAFYSKYHFIRQFKKIYGKTPYKYLVSIRLEKAAALLSNGITVTEACFSVGFESLGTFSGLFKRSIGLTPSEYRSNHLSRRTDIHRKPLAFIPGCFSLTRI